MDSGILGLVTLTECTISPGAMVVSSLCRARFRFSSIWSGSADGEIEILSFGYTYIHVVLYIISCLLYVQCCNVAGITIAMNTCTMYIHSVHVYVITVGLLVRLDRLHGVSKLNIHVFK